MPRHSNHNDIDVYGADRGNAAADNSCGDGDDDGSSDGLEGEASRLVGQKCHRGTRQQWPQIDMGCKSIDFDMLGSDTAATCPLCG